MKLILFLSLILSLTSFNIYAQDDSASLAQVQALLNDPALRQQALITPEARSADRNAEITALGQAGKKQEIYSIAAELMPWLIQETNGDMTKINTLMLEYQKNPQAFYNRIPAAQREKIKSLAGQIEQSRSGKKPGAP